MKIKNNVVLTLKEIHLNVANPRKGMYNQKEMEELKESMKMIGQLTNVKLDGEQNLLGGHRRYQAAKELGWDKLRCDIFEDLSQFTKSAILISDNTTQKQFDPWSSRKTINDIYWNEFCEEYKFRGQHDKGYSEFARLLGISEPMVRKIIISMSKENISLATKLEKSGAGTKIYDIILTSPKKYRSEMTNEAIRLIKENLRKKQKNTEGVRERLKAFQKTLIVKESKKELHPKFYQSIHRQLDYLGIVLTKDVINSADATEQAKMKNNIEKNILPAYKLLGGKEDGKQRD